MDPIGLISRVARGEMIGDRCQAGRLTAVGDAWKCTALNSTVTAEDLVSSPYTIPNTSAHFISVTNLAPNSFKCLSMTFLNELISRKYVRKLQFF